MMNNYFTSLPPHQLFFQSWGSNTPKETVLLLFGLAVLSLLLETLKHLTGTVKLKVLKCIANNSSDTYTCQDDLETTTPANQRTPTSSGVQLELSLSQSFLLNLLLTGIYVVRILIAYLLMLAVMTYNYWILLVVVFSAAIGYYLLPFGAQHTSHIQNEASTKSTEKERKTYRHLESTV